MCNVISTLLFNLVLQFLDYVVGDGPGQRYALICSTCYGHNGMALKDEFEYISKGFVISTDTYESGYSQHSDVLIVTISIQPARNDSQRPN